MSDRPDIEAERDHLATSVGLLRAERDRLREQLDNLGDYVEMEARVTELEEASERTHDSWDEETQRRIKAERRVTKLGDAILYLFSKAEHDTQRSMMLMSLREFLGLGHNLGGKQWDDDIDFAEEARAVLDRHA